MRWFHLYFVHRVSVIKYLFKFKIIIIRNSYIYFNVSQLIYQTSILTHWTNIFLHLFGIVKIWCKEQNDQEGWPYQMSTSVIGWRMYGIYFIHPQRPQRGFILNPHPVVKPPSQTLLECYCFCFLNRLTLMKWKQEASSTHTSSGLENSWGFYTWRKQSTRWVALLVHPATICDIYTKTLKLCTTDSCSNQITK